MSDYIRRNLEAGLRCRQWFIDYGALIPAASIFETRSIAMTGKVSNLELLTGQQEAAKSEGVSATDVKGFERQDLIDALNPVRDAARSAEYDVPGTRDRYRFNVSMPDLTLLAVGRSFAAGQIDDAALLTDNGAPSHWWVIVTNACDAFEATFGPQDSAKGQSVAKNAEIVQEMNEMNAIKAALRHQVKIYTANNPGARAAWNTAAHVEKAPTKTKKDDGNGDPPPTP